jgi:hypothetical protein
VPLPLSAIQDSSLVARAVSDCAAASAKGPSAMRLIASAKPLKLRKLVLLGEL